MERGTVRTCSTTMGNYGGIWATMAAYRPFSVSHGGKLWATMERGTVRVRSTTMGNYGGIWAAMAAYRPFSVSHGGKQWATMERDTFRACLTTMGNYGDVWATMSITERKEGPTITKSSVHFRAFELSCFRDPFSSCLLEIPYFVISSVKVCSSSFDFDHSPCFIGFSAS